MDVAATLLAPGQVIDGRTVASVAVCLGCRCRRVCVTVEFTDGTPAAYHRKAMVAVRQAA